MVTIVTVCYHSYITVCYQVSWLSWLPWLLYVPTFQTILCFYQFLPGLERKEMEYGVWISAMLQQIFPCCKSRDRYATTTRSFSSLFLSYLFFLLMLLVVEKFSCQSDTSCNLWTLKVWITFHNLQLLSLLSFKFP